MELVARLKKYFETYRIYIGGAMILLVIVIGGSIMAQGAYYEKKGISVITNEDITPADTYVPPKSEGAAPTTDTVIFDIEGGIIYPGVYTLPAGSVLADAIRVAGGFNTHADRERIAREINQARVIGDNSKIYLFTMVDREIVVTKATSDAPVVSGSTSSGRININAANLDDLDALPGIGPALAQRIIDWREEHDGFAILEDITKVKGIGESVFQNIKDLIIVE